MMSAVASAAGLLSARKCWWRRWPRLGWTAGSPGAYLCPAAKARSAATPIPST